MKNGHVVYVNKYIKERIRVHHKSLANRYKNQQIPFRAYEMEDNNPVELVTRIPKLNCEKLDESLIASTENIPLSTSSIKLIEPYYPQNREKEIIPTNHSFSKSYASNYLNRNFQKSDNGLEGDKDEPHGKVEGFGLTGFILSIVGLFVAGIPLGIISIVFGSIGIARVNKAHEKRKGKGFGIAAIIIGIIALVGAIVVLML